MLNSLSQGFKHTWARLLAYLLAVITVIGLLPTMAMADNGDTGGQNPGSPGGQKPSTTDVAWSTIVDVTFLRFTLVEFPQGVTADLNTNDGSAWRVVGTSLNVVWNSSVSYFTAEDYRSKVTWYDSSAMLFNGAGANAAQLMGSGVTAYSAASGNNRRRVITADEFQSATGITDQQKEQMFHLNSSSWSTGWLNGDYTSMWGTDPHPVTPDNLYNVYKANDAFVYLLGRLSETGGEGTGWSAEDALSNWTDFVYDSSGKPRTKYRVIIETGGIFLDPDGVRRAYTLREMMAYSLYNSEANAKNNLIWDQASTILNMAQWMRQAKGQFVEYPLDADGTPTGEELCSTNGFREADSFVDGISDSGKIRSTIFSERRSYGLHILNPFNFEPLELDRSVLAVTKAIGGSVPADQTFGFTVTYTADSPDGFTATKNGADCTGEVTATGSGLRFTLKGGETVRIAFEADDSFRCEVREDDPSLLTNITGTGGVANTAGNKFTTTGGSASVTFTNVYGSSSAPSAPSVPTDPARTILYKRDAKTNAGVGPATFKFSSVVNGNYEFSTNANGELEAIQWWDPTEADGRYIKPGEYAVTELIPPPNYTASDEVKLIKLELDEFGDPIPAGPLVFTNLAKPGLRIVKYDRQSHSPMSGVSFDLYRDGAFLGRYETNAAGEILLLNIEPGTYRAVEVDTGDDIHILDTSYQEIELEAGAGIKDLVFFNDSKPGLRLVKVDSSDPAKAISGAVFEIRSVAGDYGPVEFTTNASGEIDLSNLPEGAYVVTELECPGYVIDSAQRIIYLKANDTAEFVFTNTRKPSLRLVKTGADGSPLEGVTFRIAKIEDGTHYLDRTTGANGEIYVEDLEPGVYSVVETATLPDYILDETEHHVELSPGRTAEIRLTNEKRPSLTVKKVDSVTGEPIEGVKFQIWRGSDHTSTGEYNDLGIYYTDANGKIHLERLDTSWYKVKELEPAPGYVIRQPDTQEIYLAAGQERTLVFENTPKSKIIVQKYDSVTHEPLPGCLFQLRQFSNVSGTEGTVISRKVTGEDGAITWTGLTPGAYVVQEVDAADGYNITNASETVYLADDGEQNTVTLLFTNDPDGSLLIRKVCSVNPSVTLQNAEFKVLYTDGSVVGNSNGIYRTDENGEIFITGLAPGKSVVVTETRAPDGFILDTLSQTIQIKAGQIMTLTFKNQPKGSLIIQKRDSQTGEVLPGAEFRITTAAGCEVGLDGVIGTSTLTQNGIFVTDAQGEIKITNLAPGAYVLTEIKAPDGYVIDTPSTNVVIGTNGDTQTVVVKNTKKGNLVIEKYDSVTRQPLRGAQFKITTASGELVADNGGLTGTNGLYTTDVNGKIVLPRLLPGTYIVTETTAPDNYQIDPTPQTVVVHAGDTQTLRFFNDPLCSLTILKRDAVTKQPLQGAEFTVRDSEGRAIGPGNGVYTTGSNGTVTVSGLTPNATIVVSESKAPAGYVLDETPQHIVVRSGAVNILTFDDVPTAVLVIHKYIEGTDREPLAGVAFKIVDGSGAPVGTGDGTFYTDAAGEIVIEGLNPGETVTAWEIKTVEGYVLDGTPKSARLTAGQASELIFWNKQAGTLVIQKKDSVSGELIPGAQFQLTYANGGYVDADNGHLSSNGLYTTDANGEIRISGIVGTVVAKEIQPAPGYVINADTQTQTVTVYPMDTQTLTFLNDPLCSLTIKKLDSVTGKPVPGAVFEVRKGSTNILGNYTTGQYGTVTVTGLIPESTYMVTEVKVPAGYVLDSTPKVITVQNGANTLSGNSLTNSSNPGTGSDNDLTFENDPKMTLTIRKYIEGTNYEPLSGVCFMVTDSRGTAIGPGDGTFYTNAAGEIVIEGLEPGTTVIAREIKTVDGFVLDGTPKSVVIEAGKTAPELIFWNKRAGTLVIQKKDSVTGELIPGAQFQLTYANGGYVDADNGHLSSNGIYTTDQNGEIRISGIVGTVVAKEVQAAPGYVIDPATQSQTVTVNPMDTQLLTFLNDPLCSLTILKRDAVTGKPLQGAEFIVKDSEGKTIGSYTTGSDGTVTVTGLIPGATYVVTEVKVPNGYVLNTVPQTITVVNGKNTLGGSSGSTGNGLVFEDDPKMILTIHKYIEGTDYEPLAGVCFMVTDSRGTAIGPGNGEFYTDAAGEIVIEGLEPGATVIAREIKTVDGFVLDGTPKSVVIEAGKTAPELIFWNKRAGTLVIQKKDSVTGKLIPGAQFQLTYADGGYVDNDNGHLSSNGIYTTDANGEIRISGIAGTVVAKEVQAAPGYVIDPATQTQTVTVNPMDTQILTFYNAPKQTLTIQKYVDGTTIPIRGVTFLVTDGSGAVVGPSNGEYVTDRNGRIVITDLTPGVTITAKEIRTVNGYVLDPTPQSIQIKSGVAQTLTFFNKPVGGLELIKVSEADTTQRIPGVTFEIRRMDGGLVDTITTGDNGRIHVYLDAGDYYAVETVAAQGFKLDSTPHYFTVTDGKTTTLTVTNKPFSGILIHKTDSVTGKGIYGVTFLLYDSTYTPIGQYTSDNLGYVYIENLSKSGRYYLRELENQGYIVDTQLKTVYVQAGETTLIEWQNTPITGQIQVTKTSEDYNSMNGWPAGTPIPGTEFEIYDYRTGNLVDTVRTDKNGVAVSRPLPLGRYKIVESKAADFYALDKTPIEVELEYAGQIVRAAMTNKSLYTNVSIKKTGYYEVMAGQTIRYTFSEIGNNSTTALTSFYWDTLPVNAVRLSRIVTGTYNAAGNYKIVYKTNLSGGEYRTMYDNLSTAVNYTLDVSPVALGLASNEYVTEFMLVFGVVPANFRQVETPKVDCTVLSTVQGGSQFTNTADVGGVYNGQWIQAVTRWTTTVYGKPAQLPKTGY